MELGQLQNLSKHCISTFMLKNTAHILAHDTLIYLTHFPGSPHLFYFSVVIFFFCDVNIQETAIITTLYLSVFWVEWIPVSLEPGCRD